MTPQPFYWKPITSEADLPKEEGEYVVQWKTGGTINHREFHRGFGNEWIAKWWLETFESYACPLPPAGEEMEQMINTMAQERVSLTIRIFGEEAVEMFLKAYKEGARAIASILAEKDREIERLKGELKEMREIYFNTDETKLK